MTSAQPPGTGEPSGSATPGTDQPSASQAPTGTSAAPVPWKKDEADALQLALRSENAAIWAYALVAANDKDDAAAVTDLRAGHLVRRDAAAELLTRGGASPAAPAPAYSTPPVTDLTSARALAIAIETDCAAAWRSVVANTDNTNLRTFAATGLSDSAVRLAQWKQRAKASPLTVPFPGAQS